MQTPATGLMKRFALLPSHLPRSANLNQGCTNSFLSIHRRTFLVLYLLVYKTYFILKTPISYVCSCTF